MTLIKKGLVIGYKALLLTCLVIIPFYAYTVSADENPYNFGIPNELDATTIQVYYQEEATLRGEDHYVNVRIPQDKTTLEYDYFYVLIDVRDDLRRYFTVEYWEFNTTSNRTTNLLLRWTFSVKREDNEWLDPRFGQIRIDESNFYVFTQTDEKRLFIIKYQGVEIKFYHKTNPALVKEIVTRGAFTATVLFYGFQSLIYLTVSLFFSSRIKNKLNTWVRFNFTTVGLIFSWAILGFTAIALAQNMTEYDILRQIIQVPASSLLFAASIVFGMWIPSFFTTKPSTLHVIKYNPLVDTADIIKNYIFGNATKDPKKFVKTGYEHLEVVQTDSGKRYYRDAHNLIELIGSFLHGSTAIKSTEKAFLIEVNLQTKVDYKKTFYERVKEKIKEQIGELGLYFTESVQKQELLFVTDMRWKKTQTSSNFILNRIIDNKYYTTGIFIIIAFAIALFLAWVGQTLDIIGIFMFTLALIYVVYLIFDHTKKYKYLEIDPLPRSVLELIYDSKRVFKSERIISKELRQLKDKNNELQMKLHVVEELEASKEDILDEKVLFPSTYEEKFKDAEKKIQKKIDEIRYPEELEEPEKTSKEGSKANKGGSVI